MSQLEILNFRDININSFKFNKPSRNVGNSYIAKTNYSKIRRVIQLPKLRTPQGIITIDKKEYLTLEIDKYNWDVFDFFSNMDEYCIKYISDESFRWFEIDYNVQSIESSYKNSVKLTSTKKLPIIRLRIPPGERTNIHFFDENKNEINIDNIVNNINIVVLIELEGLRFLRSQVIPIWNLLQAKIYKDEIVPTNLSEYLIIDDILDNVERFNLENQVTLENQETLENHDENSDSEDEYLDDFIPNLNIKNMEIDNNFSNFIEVL